MTRRLPGSRFFYAIGLGVGPRHGYVGWLLVWSLIFGAQIAFSRWWLARHPFGPMIHVPPLRLAPAATG